MNYARKNLYIKKVMIAFESYLDNSVAGSLVKSEIFVFIS